MEETFVQRGTDNQDERKAADGRARNNQNEENLKVKRELTSL